MTDFKLNYAIARISYKRLTDLFTHLRKARLPEGIYQRLEAKLRRKLENHFDKYRILAVPNLLKSKTEIDAYTKIWHGIC
jgi:hypothetical protein